MPTSIFMEVHCSLQCTLSAVINKMENYKTSNFTEKNDKGTKKSRAEKIQPLIIFSQIPFSVLQRFGI